MSLFISRILHGRINDKLGASYWYSLGASIIVTFIKAFENLDKFYDAYSKMRAAGIFGGSNAASSAGGGGDDDVLDRMDISDDISHGRSRRTIIEPSSSKDLASRVLSIQMRFLFQRSSLDKDSCWNGYQDFIDVVADRLDSFEADDDNHEDGDENLLSVKRGRGAYQYFPKEIKQTLFVLLMTFSELDVIFLESGKIRLMKQNIFKGFHTCLSLPLPAQPNLSHL